MTHDPEHLAERLDALHRDASAILRAAERDDGLTEATADDAITVLVQVVGVISDLRKRAPRAPAKRAAAKVPAGMFQVTVGRGVTRQVTSLPQASVAVRDYIVSKGWGNGQWAGPGVGLVRDAKGKPVARISYNGRAWAVDARGRDLERELPL